MDEKLKYGRDVADDRLIQNEDCGSTDENQAIDDPAECYKSDRSRVQQTPSSHTHHNVDDRGAT